MEQISKRNLLQSKIVNDRLSIIDNSIIHLKGSLKTKNGVLLIKNKINKYVDKKNAVQAIRVAQTSSIAMTLSYL